MYYLLYLHDDDLKRIEAKEVKEERENEKKKELQERNILSFVMVAFFNSIISFLDEVPWLLIHCKSE